MMGRAVDMSVPPVRPVASLSTALLASKGAARPAMRSQLAIALERETGSGEEAALEDLGWNDMGEAPLRVAGRVVNFPGEAVQRVPEPAKARRRPPGTALKQGRKAAFTLRLDAERHERLRRACSLDECSAQALVTDALDRLLAELPEIDSREIDAPARRVSAPAARRHRR